MITLTDSIKINTTPEEIFDWFINLDKNFTQWHPNHNKFIKVTGGMNEGDIVRYEERIDGKCYKFNAKISKIEKTKNGWQIEVKAPFSKIQFAAEVKGDSCIFKHTETFGFLNNNNAFNRKVVVPLLKSILNPLYRFDIIAKDMVEDNINLKRILENNPK
jgi:hypothetical protein